MLLIIFILQSTLAKAIERPEILPRCNMPLVRRCINENTIKKNNAYSSIQEVNEKSSILLILKENLEKSLSASNENIYFLNREISFIQKELTFLLKKENGSLSNSWAQAFFLLPDQTSWLEFQPESRVNRLASLLEKKSADEIFLTSLRQKIIIDINAHTAAIHALEAELSALVTEQKKAHYMCEAGCKEEYCP